MSSVANDRHGASTTPATTAAGPPSTTTTTLRTTAITHSTTPPLSSSSHTVGSDGEYSSVYSSVSVASSYRHHSQGPFAPSNHRTLLDAGDDVRGTASSYAQPPPPQPVLSQDVHHIPKTTGSVGVLLVGLGGANGTTLLAGILAHRRNVTWYGPRGQVQRPNWYGCLTQLIPDANSSHAAGYKDQVQGLADATLAAVGGWVSSVWTVWFQCICWWSDPGRLT